MVWLKCSATATRFGAEFWIQRYDWYALSRLRSFLKYSGNEAARDGDNHALQNAPGIPELLVASKACSCSRDLEIARKIHTQACDGSNIYLATSLVDMFAKCRSMIDACAVFDRMPCQNVVSWTALVLGYVEIGKNAVALEVFTRIAAPDALSFVAALVACANLATAASDDGHQLNQDKLQFLETGMALHSRALQAGYDESIVSLANTLISMYAKCGSLVDARMVFDRAPQHTVVSWNALIAGYVENGEEELGLELFWWMVQQHQHCLPDSRTLVAALTACTSLVSKEDGVKVDGKLVKLKGMEQAMAIHSQAVRAGQDKQVYVASSIINLYAKCGSMVDAILAFYRMETRDVVSWTSLILGYGESGEGELGLELFRQMQAQGCYPDARTYVSVLRACGDCADRDENVTQVDGKLVKVTSLEKAFPLHCQAARDGFLDNVFVATSLVDVYAKCGSLLDARMVFDRMQYHSPVSWNALILGYAENGDAEVALDIFSRMRAQDGCEASDSRAFVAALIACGSLVALELGKVVHGEVLRLGLETDTYVANCLVDFYSRCASMASAHRVFESISSSSRNLVTWSALMCGYSRRGKTDMVFSLFEMLKNEGHRADGITFLALLTACSHAGLVERGKRYFQEILSSQETKPLAQHYDCMVDLLGRANYLDEAVLLVKSMPYKPNVVTWNAVLGACRKWKNVELGRLAFNTLVELNEKQASTYLTMASIYGSVGMWEEQAKILSMKRLARPWKEPGVSCWTDHHGVVHRFRAGDCSHAQSEAVGIKLKQLLVRMKEGGYVAQLSSISCNVSDCQKEEALCEHSERLAIACALINTAPGAVIRIVKNLRVCDDCHQATAVISAIERRRIICRDSSRFHVFEGGKCSCGDFW
ncbi:pentatricopeptide repeat-containing protein At3g12770-like [Selaginella moellendorffii]|uniref:pentatricopeptide repeat-containing protein At3g12770-like n=2 Tax=Selaginella moellendorffii TaxID=88036 RepID=UPI000D1C6D67|nr:pentatricopeptide repeat-containing protein At3g12770-like [Selaginella moellendorffii]|eukprot:XP_024534143.1 pentatricopeptide repeat-containing protein At3g12770-like [Selaginella moellendorffii]